MSQKGAFGGAGWGAQVLRGFETRFRRNELNTFFVTAAVSRRIRLNRATVARTPPFHALRADRALPASVRGPVDCFQGHKARILSACFWRASVVQRGIGGGVEWSFVAVVESTGDQGFVNLLPKARPHNSQGVNKRIQLGTKGYTKG